METLPTELGVLTCLMIFAATLWLPFVIGISTDPDDPDNFTRPADLKTLRPWVHRAHRAQANLIEQAVPFSVLLIIVFLQDGLTNLTYWTTIAFFWIRIIHAFGMIIWGIGMPIRPIIFSLGWLCCLIMAYAVFTA